VLLGASLALSVVLSLIPGSLVSPIRQVVQAVLRPGLVAAGKAVAVGGACRGTVASRWSQAAEDMRLRAELRRQQARVRELEAELIAAQLRPKAEARATEVSRTEPLVRGRLIEARLLGRQARAFLARHQWIDAGQSAGVAAGDWVLDPPALVDQGRSAGLAPGNLVLASPVAGIVKSPPGEPSAGNPHELRYEGRCVWGKVMESAAHTSGVLRLTEPGYRDLVQLAQPQGNSLKLGPRGVLEGTGERHCRIRLIAAAEPVSVGDLVVTTGHEGLTLQPLLYGEVVHAELPPGASHWEISVKPAVSGVESVAVLVTGWSGTETK
jgi:cell shape-determining protein MreC